MANYRELSRELVVSGLNERQLEAVNTLEGPLLVLAGAGTGKTTVITRRILNLVRSGVRPEQILALTFTKKAAREMYERVSKLLGCEPRGMVISTFHALGFRLLRHEGHRVGLKREAALVSRATQGDIAKRVLQEIDRGGELSDVHLLTAISRAKNHGLTPTALEEQAKSGSSRKLARAYKQYEEALRAESLIDFDDMITLSLRLLREAELVRRECLRRWPFLLVDEYQDTSCDQYELVKLLLGRRQNLCVVGDDDQSIYRFRGAEVGNILAFESDFPNAKVVVLETNYRSTGEIVELANRVIERAKKRYQKRLVSAAGRAGLPVRLLHAKGEQEEESLVVREVKRLSQAGVSFSEMAVLHRVGQGLSAFAERFAREGIPYQRSVDTVPSGNVPGVSMMTLHAAKGLEFPHVFIPAVEEGTIPHFNAVKEGAEAIEEERRLLYVGLTRARRELLLTTTGLRGPHQQRRSRFLKDLRVPRAVLDVWAR